MVRLGLPDPVLSGHFNHTDPGQNGLLYKVLTTRGKLARESNGLEVGDLGLEEGKIKPSQE